MTLVELEILLLPTPEWPVFHDTLQVKVLKCWKQPTDQDRGQPTSDESHTFSGQTACSTIARTIGKGKNTARRWHGAGGDEEHLHTSTLHLEMLLWWIQAILDKKVFGGKKKKSRLHPFAGYHCNNGAWSLPWL